MSMTKETSDRVSLKIIEISFYALFFFTPLLMFQGNSELFELPKMFFVWAATTLIFGLWLIRMIVNGKVIFQRTFLDLFLLSYLVTQLLSYWLSIDHHTSLWGYYSRFNGGFAASLAYTLLYWSFVSNMTIQNTLYTIRYMLISALLVALWGIPSHFGYDPTCALLGFGFNTNCWTEQFVPTVRIFSTLGQPNWLAAWLVALLPLAWCELIFKYQFSIFNFKKLFRVTCYLLLVALLTLALFYTNSKSGFAGFAVALVVFLAGIAWILKKSQLFVKVVTVGLVGIVVGGVLALPHVPTLIRPVGTCLSIMFPANYRLPTTNHELRTDITSSSDIRCIVWRGAIDIWQTYPLLGTGPETFAYSYYQFKSPQHNLTSEWNFLYNKAHNEYLNMAANTGSIGLVAYFILIGAIAYLFLRNFQIENSLEIGNSQLVILALAAGWTSILVTNFFGFSVIPVQLQFFLYPAFAFMLTNSKLPASPAGRQTPNSKLSTPFLPKLIAISSVLILISYFLLLLFRYFLADIHYSQTKNFASHGDYTNALSSIRKVLELRSNEPVYLDELSNVLSSIVVLVSPTNPEAASEAAELAIKSSDKALASSPGNLNFLNTRSSMFVKLSTLDLNYMENAKIVYEQAALLAPTNVQTQYNLGTFYLHIQDYTLAKQVLEYTVSLRPNFRDARFALAQTLWELREKEHAKDQLNLIIKTIYPDDQEVIDKLKEWEKF